MAILAPKRYPDNRIYQACELFHIVDVILSCGLLYSVPSVAADPYIGLPSDAVQE